jgi:hypothetical protein
MNLVVHDLRGGTSRNIAIPYIPARIAKAVIDSVLAVFPPVGEATLRAALSLPEFWPPARAVVVGDDGTVWLERQGEFPSCTWTRIGARGEVTGVVTVPAGYRILDARRNEVVAAIEAPDDSQPPVIIYTVHS